VYSDTDAVEARLADGIRTFDEVLASLTAQVSQTSQTQTAAAAANTGASAMTTQKRRHRHPPKLQRRPNLSRPRLS
jgi:hypothetical protein